MILSSLNQSLDFIVQQTKNNLNTLAIIIAILWIAYFLVVLSGQRLLSLGIFPRRLSGLIGIIFAPVLHANFNHLFFNTIPLLILTNFILIQGLAYYLWVTGCITLLSGLAIWCFAKPGLHVGASAVVTGYWALLICNTYQQGGVTNIILGVISLYYFAGLLLGIFPNKRGVSWEGHLFGLLAGFATSFFLPH